MDINERLYVEIHPMEGAHGPHPHPIADGGFDPDCVYKVLGMYNPSETSECYFVLSNPQRQIWFIPQRHLRAFGLIDSDQLMITRHEATAMIGASTETPGKPAGDGNGQTKNGNGHGNGHQPANWPHRLGSMS